jgi:molybdopterin converting factor small subunit
MIQVRFFAGLRELVGSPETRLPWQLNVTVADLRKQLEGHFPRAVRLLRLSRAAVGDQLADDSTPIPENAEVAFLPPVSGG